MLLIAETRASAVPDGGRKTRVTSKAPCEAATVGSIVPSL
jgi:hypothetical protein